MTEADSLLIEEKKFYERFQALHSNPKLVEIYKRFGIRVFRRSCVLEGFEQFLVDADFNGRCCVEIGTCKGLTAIVLACHFEEVVSIDITPDEEKHEIAAYVGATNIRFIDVTDNAEKAIVLSGVDFNAAFLDGDHARDTDSDFALACMAKNCRRVLFHEYWEAQPAVFDLVNKLNRDGAVRTQGKFALWTR